MKTFYQERGANTLRSAVAGLVLMGTASQGTSEVSRFVAKQQRQGRAQLLSSNAFGVEAAVASSKLWEVFFQCQERDWDGYGASGVCPRTFQLAHHFLSALPLGTATPDFGADPDGDMTFEWYRAGRTLSVAVSADGDLHYAALIGARKSYGTEPFFGEVPNVILGLIRDVV